MGIRGSNRCVLSQNPLYYPKWKKVPRVKLFRTSGMIALALVLMPQLAWAAAPKDVDKQARHEAENTCAVIDNGAALACVGGAPKVDEKVRAWMEERVALLQAQPELSETDQAILQEFEDRLSGTGTHVTIEPLPH